MPTRGWAITQIRQLASAGRVHVDIGHPTMRMGQRGVDYMDIMNALRNVRTAREQMPSRRWLVTGPMMDGRRLKLAVILADDVIVCTVMPEGMES